MISAPTTATNERRNAWRTPVMMNGEAPGTMTFQKRSRPSAPIAPAALSHSGLTERTPVHAFSTIGNVAA